MQFRAHSSLRDGGECLYLPDRQCRFVVLSVTVPIQQVIDNDLDPGSILRPEDVEMMLSRGYFRQGTEFWIQSCPNCRECIPMRIPVERFQRSRSQRRTWRRNQDVEVEIGPLEFTLEKFDLISRHRTRFSITRPLPEDSCRRWWHILGRNVLEFRYRLEGRLVGLALIDPTPRAAASMEFWHAVDRRRNFGTFSLLYELEWARTTGRSHLYLGPYVAGSAAMSYKAGFRPYELLDAGAGWIWREVSP